MAIIDAHCQECGFLITDGVYAYMAGRLIFCQRCVKGPHPYGHEPTRKGVVTYQRRPTPASRPALLPLDDVLPMTREDLCLDTLSTFSS